MNNNIVRDEQATGCKQLCNWSGLVDREIDGGHVSQPDVHDACVHLSNAYYNN